MDHWIRVALEMQGLLKDAEVLYFYEKKAGKAISLGDQAITLYEENKELSAFPVVKELYKYILNFVGNIYLDMKDDKDRFKTYIDKFYKTY